MEIRRSLMRRPNLSVRSTPCALRSSLVALRQSSRSRSLGLGTLANSVWRKRSVSNVQGIVRCADAERALPSFPFQAREARTFPSTPSVPPSQRDTAAATLGIPVGCGGRKQYRNYRCPNGKKAARSQRYGGRRPRPPKKMMPPEGLRPEGAYCPDFCSRGSTCCFIWSGVKGFRI